MHVFKTAFLKKKKKKLQMLLAQKYSIWGFFSYFQVNHLW